MIETAIVGMGGGQMYINNKVKYMESLGWKVIVFSGIKGCVIIPNLNRFLPFIYDELANAPFVFPRRVIENVINKLANVLNDYTEVVVESGSPHASYWGELLAERINGKHIAFILDERPDRDIVKEYLPFYHFKASRKELAGITENTVKLIFNDCNIRFNYDTSLPALCQNVVEDYENDLVDLIPKDGYNICILGRLNKKYIFEAVHGIEELASCHLEDKFNIIFIGDSDSKTHKEGILKELRKYSNIKPVFFGYLFPLPSNIFTRFDFCISSAGSAGVCYRQGVPTISIDGKDGKAIGVLGYSTSNTLYRKDEPLIEINELLEQIIYDSYLNNYEYVEQPYIPNMSDLNKHISFLNGTINIHEYYPIYNIKPVGKEKKKSIFIRIFGKWVFLKIRPWISNLYHSHASK